MEIKNRKNENKENNGSIFSVNLLSFASCEDKSCSVIVT